MSRVQRRLIAFTAGQKYIVYKHTAPNGKVYIGLTKQTVSERWRDGKGYKNNVLFYADIQKFGWNNIKHEVIARYLTEEEGMHLEAELIHQYKSIFPEYGYNRRPGEEYHDEFKDAKEARKQSEEQQQYYPTVEPKKYVRPLSDTCWVTDGNYETLIQSDLLDEYIAKGFRRGRLADDIIYMHKGDECIRIHEYEELDYIADGWIKGKTDKIAENVRKGRQKYIWICDGKEFVSAQELSDYLRTTHYPKIVPSTITAMFRGKIYPAYPDLLNIVSRRPIEH